MTSTNNQVRALSSLKAMVMLFSAIAVFGTVTDATAHDDDDDCRAPHGNWTSYAVAPPACDSPVGICTMGTLTGGLPSTYYFVMDTLAWAGDYTNPGLFVYTGHSVVTDSHGHKFFGSDSGQMQMNPDPTGPSAFVTTVHIVGGTANHKHATGQIVAPGQIVFATGQAVGTYTSSICNDNGNGNDDDDDGHGNGHGKNCH